tara:strand:+ start:4123 stop:4986 length:864 start_codon:yes stop_codon:yes gene_type:complete
MGGNVFKDDASPIKREDIRPTYVEYIRHLGGIFPNKAEVFKNFTLVGSAGRKEISGDLDLAIDINKFFDGKQFNKAEMMDWLVDYDEWEKYYLKLKSRARTSTDNMVKWRAFLKLIGDVIQSDSLINVSDRNTNGNLFTLFPQFDRYGQISKFVQIDWMVGDIRWLKFAYHSNESSNLKGLHRTQFIVAMASAKGYTFLHTKGIKSKSNHNFVATTPEQAAALFSKLYGPLQMKQTDNYDSLHAYLKKNSSEEEYKAVIHSYLKILRTCRATIPLDLKNEDSRFTWP